MQVLPAVPGAGQGRRQSAPLLRQAGCGGRAEPGAVPEEQPAPVQHVPGEADAVQRALPEEFTQPPDGPVPRLVAQGHRQAQHGLHHEVQVQAAVF